jgi:ABC-type bacteriocin/lantibiotic exporter with double-glycine peptidase domain
LKEDLKGINKIKFTIYLIIYSIECIIFYIVPLLISNYLNESVTLDKIYVFIIIFIAINIVRILIRVFVKRYIEFYLNSITYIVSNNVISRVINSNIKNMSDKGTGYINNVIKRYNIAIDKAVENVMFYVPDAALAIIIFVYSAMTKSFMLGIYFIITLSISVIIYMILQKKQELYMDEYNKEESDYYKHYVDYILNIRTVKLLNLYEYIKRILDFKTKKALGIAKNRYVIEMIKEFIVRTITFIPIILGIVYGINEFKNGQVGFGTIMFFVLISGDLRFVVRVIGDASKIYSEYKVSKKNLEECLEKTSKNKIIKDFKSLAIKNLKFNYNESKFKIIVKEFIVNKFDKVAIIGKSGQGKTTLLNILTGNIKTNNKYIDGKNVEENLEYGYVSQEAEMFNTTIRENLCLGKEVDEKYIINLLSDLMLKTWFDTLENGFDTQIGEKGIKLSTGQKQRLNILRAIIQNKEIYILDEPTSNLDEHTEEKVIECINKYLGNKTLIIVTHRPKVLSICNKVYRFEDHILNKEM